MLRVVLDPNVFVAAHLNPSGAPARVLAAADRRVFRLVISPDLVAELDEVLHRPKFANRIDAADADRTVLDPRRTAEIHYPASVVVPITRDSDDDYLVQLVRESRADALVTGDRDLLEADLHDVQGLTPRRFLDEIELSNSPR